VGKPTYFFAFLFLRFIFSLTIHLIHFSSSCKICIENILLYLESKKLIRCKSYENIRQGIKRTVYFITEKGIDFLDGNVAETGLADG